MSETTNQSGCSRRTLVVSEAHIEQPHPLEGCRACRAIVRTASWRDHCCWVFADCSRDGVHLWSNRGHYQRPQCIIEIRSRTLSGKQRGCSRKQQCDIHLDTGELSLHRTFPTRSWRSYVPQEDLAMSYFTTWGDGPVSDGFLSGSGTGYAYR